MNGRSSKATWFSALFLSVLSFLSMFLSSHSDTCVGVVNPSNSTVQMWDSTKTVGVPLGVSTQLGVAGLTAFTMITSSSFVVGDDEGGLHLYELRGEEGWTYADRIGNHRRGVTALLCLRDGQLVSGASDGTVAFWDLSLPSLFKCVFMIDDEYHEDPVVAFHQAVDGRLILLNKRGLSTWGLSGEEPTELMGYSWPTINATCVSMLADGRIAVGREDGVIQILTESSDTDWWDWALLDGHAGAVTAVYGCPDGTLFSLGSDGALFVWDPETQQIVDALEGLGSEGSACLSAGRVAYYGNERVYVWTP